MKRGDESTAPGWRRFTQPRVTPRIANSRKLVTLLQIHPVRTSRSEILALAMHFLVKSAAEHGTAPPELSEDAATYLSTRRWDAKDLAGRVARAVAGNQGSLITAEDLSQS